MGDKVQYSERASDSEKLSYVSVSFLLSKLG